MNLVRFASPLAPCRPTAALRFFCIGDHRSESKNEAFQSLSAENDRFAERFTKSVPKTEYVNAMFSRRERLIESQAARQKEAIKELNDEMKKLEELMDQIKTNLRYNRVYQLRQWQRGEGLDMEAVASRYSWARVMFFWLLPFIGVYFCLILVKNKLLGRRGPDFSKYAV